MKKLLPLLIVSCLFSLIIASDGQVSSLSLAVSWLRQHAIQLRTSDPQASLDDLTPLSTLIGDAALVGMGEGTHGSHEFFTMKHRLLKFLVEEKHFTLFAIEGSWSAGETINEYVLEGKGTAEEVVQLFHFWTWNTREVVDMLKWMRAYNANSSHTQKVAFAGFDCQAIEAPSYDKIARYLQSIDPDGALRVAQWYHDLRPDPSVQWYQADEAYLQLDPSIRQARARQASEVVSWLQQHQESYVEHSSLQSFNRTLQEARVISQWAEFMSLFNTSSAISINQQRDKAMAANVAWLHEQTEEGKRMVLWAHDLHIASERDLTQFSQMGLYLRQQYGAGYFAIGMSFYEGAFNAKGMDSKLRSFSMNAVDQQGYMLAFGLVGLPFYAIDLRHLPQGTVKQWMDGPQPFIIVGAVYDEVPQHYLVNGSLTQMFDLVIHFQHITASQMLPFTDM